MLARPTLKRSEDQTERPAPTQARPSDERYVLKVDGQAKRSFANKDAALRLGAEIKGKYPVVVVSVADTTQATTEIVGAAD